MHPKKESTKSLTICHILILKELWGKT